MGIVGESGSGKSVTSASVMRLMPSKTGKIVDGSIIFDGVDIRNLSEAQMEKFRGDECCMIFQNPMTSLDPVFKIGHQMVEMIREHEKVSKKEAWNKAVEALKLVGIPEARNGWMLSSRAFRRYVPACHHRHGCLRTSEAHHR